MNTFSAGLFLIFVFTGFFQHNAHAAVINLEDFDQKNFWGMGNYCGLHMEVAGDRLIVSIILPPS